ncbi:MAG: hypothetical protein ABI652_02830 [Acidobacteriota bacterium]
MQRRGEWMPWVMTAVMFVVVAIAAYSFGAHRQGMAVGTGAPGDGWHYYPFGGIWMFFMLFWIFGGLRWMFWGGYRPWRYRRYYPGRLDAERDDWGEWHRREHERMNSPAGSASSPRSESHRGQV